MGDRPGHPFRGNQWTAGHSEGRAAGEKIVKDSARNDAFRKLTEAAMFNERLATSYGVDLSLTDEARVSKREHHRGLAAGLRSVANEKAYAEGVAARKGIRPVRVDKHGEPINERERARADSAATITPAAFGNTEAFSAYVRGLRGEALEAEFKPATPARDVTSYETRIRRAGRGAQQRGSGGADWSKGYGRG